MDGFQRPQRARTDSHEPSRSKSKRLSRSFRQTQQNQAPAAELDSPQNFEFKTPTRPARVVPALNFESPLNDSDQQQDIIWDTSPFRPGKRGSKISSAVDISEIVSRIAPRHGRPKVSEPVLEQWIGDNVAIPCTPDPQAPKPKKKSPRPSGVDDLLKLAQQFDMNMYRQDDLDHSQDLLSDHRVQPATQMLNSPKEMDDLDLLFDEPTQQISVNLSQVSDLLTDLRTDPVPGDGRVPTEDSSGKDSATKESQISVRDDAAEGGFPDDWENDDFLEDSLVLEMTQDPFKFTAPKLCSTQKPSNQLGSPVSPVSKPRRSTFKLGSQPRFSFGPSLGSDLRSKTETLDQIRVPGVAEGSMRQVTSADVISDDFLDNDLDAIFSCEPVWDDPADDDLLCEVCNDLENQILNVSTTQIRPTIQRSILQPTSRTGNHLSPANQPTTLEKGSCVQTGSDASRRRATPSQQQFTFKKPKKLPLVPAGTCSEAEIELKKRQAMERRRQRELCRQLAPPT